MFRMNTVKHISSCTINIGGSEMANRRNFIVMNATILDFGFIKPYQAEHYFTSHQSVRFRLSVPRRNRFELFNLICPRTKKVLQSYKTVVAKRNSRLRSVEAAKIGFNHTEEMKFVEGYSIYCLGDYHSHT